MPFYRIREIQEKFFCYGRRPDARSTGKPAFAGKIGTMLLQPPEARTRTESRLATGYKNCPAAFPVKARRFYSPTTGL